MKSEQKERFRETRLFRRQGSSRPKDYDPFDDMQDADRYDAVPVVGIIIIIACATATVMAGLIAFGYWMGSC